MLKKNYKYSLLDDALEKDDLKAAIDVIKSKQITMSEKTIKFEKYFAKKMGTKFALMVNSGSSANLLAFSALTNPLCSKRIKKNDEVIVPALCWPTSVWPIVQNNLKPVFVDIEKDSLNINADQIEKKITSKTKAVMCLHILGTCGNFSQILKIVKKYNLILIEDTCESLGATYKKKFLGTFGEFGTYSFYYSHQITSGEGGMIVCNDEKNYNILRSLRSHGWSRGNKFHKKNIKKNININSKFLFINSGYNLRPTDIQASMAFNQFKKLKKFMEMRKNNRNKIINNLVRSKNWKNQFQFIHAKQNLKPSWFGLPIILNKKYATIKDDYLNFLENKGIETRPILTGNFLDQPAAQLFKLNKNINKSNFENTNDKTKRGFFIGIHVKKISIKILNLLTNNILKIDEIYKRKKNRNNRVNRNFRVNNI